jgi:hypothetical protein
MLVVLASLLLVSVGRAQDQKPLLPKRKDTTATT